MTLDEIANLALVADKCQKDGSPIALEAEKAIRRLVSGIRDSRNKGIALKREYSKIKRSYDNLYNVFMDNGVRILSADGSMYCPNIEGFSSCSEEGTCLGKYKDCSECHKEYAAYILHTLKIIRR